jgi:predicted PurR-regulated permease PerM
MRLFKKISKHFVFTNQHIALIIWLQLVVLLLVLALSVYASFIFSKIEQVGEQITGLEMQNLRLINEQTEINKKLDSQQAMMLRLQSQSFRQSILEEN